MSEVWCVIGGPDGRSGTMAHALIARGNAVAIPSADVSPFAMLVNRHHDAVLPVETRDAELDTLRDALDAIEESFGAIDVIAVILPTPDPPQGLANAVTARIAATAHTFVQLRPDSSTVIVTGTPDDTAERENDLRVLNAALEARLRKAVASRLTTHRQVSVATMSEIVRPAPPAASDAARLVG